MSSAMEPNRRRLGADVVVDTLVDMGMTTFFMNPGTSEVHLVAAIDANKQAHPILCLHEGVATGAADGYARMANKPAVVLLHLGPGLANGLANLHNAKKARSPMIVIVGEHAARHRGFDTPLNSDINTLAQFAAKKTFFLSRQEEVEEIVTQAAEECMRLPRGPVIIVADVDTMWAAASGGRSSVADPHLRSATAPLNDNEDGAAIDQVAEMAKLLNCRKGDGRTMLLLGGAALCAEGIALAHSIANRYGAAVYSETFNARHTRGAGIPHAERLPYLRDAAVSRLDAYSTILLIGSRPPVAFFASPFHDRGELTASDTRQLALPNDVDPLSALRQLAERLDIAQAECVPQSSGVELLAGDLNAKSVWAALSNKLPEGSVVSEEAGVTCLGADEAMRHANRHDWLNLTGGAIGQAIPVATGAALHTQKAKVVAMQGDGGAMYTIQALWTQARERLPVVNVILANDRYAILDYEIKNHGLPKLSDKGSRMFSLADPRIDWLSLGQSLGVPALTADTAESFAECLEVALAAEGPYLIEARLSTNRKKTST